MLQSISIKNFKSIHDETIELARVNVFIGENGCGKTNILEALAMAGAAQKSRFDYLDLLNKGVRVARPSLMENAFKGAKANSNIRLVLQMDKEVTEPLEFELKADQDEISTEWELVAEGELKGKLNAPLLQELARKLRKTEGLDQQQMQTLFGPYFVSEPFFRYLSDYLIYNVNDLSLRGISNESKVRPVGVYGEGLDDLLYLLSKEDRALLVEKLRRIDWFDSYLLDESDELKREGHKLGRSQSKLYFKDRFLGKSKIFSLENANEGILHLLFYYSVLLSERTPRIFAIDNIEKSLNPRLCREMMKDVCELAVAKSKQVLITTQNPAVLDGLNLHDENVRLFVVSRNEKGHTRTKRIKLKPDQPEGQHLRLSEMWMRGLLGGIPTNF